MGMIDLHLLFLPWRKIEEQPSEALFAIQLSD